MIIEHNGFYILDVSASVLPGLETDERKRVGEATHMHSEKIRCLGAQADGTVLGRLLGGSVARCYALPACLGFGLSVPLQASIMLRREAHM